MATANPDLAAGHKAETGAALAQQGEGRLRVRQSSGVVRPFSRLNDRLAVVLVAIVLLAPLPLASNRPVWWMIWGLVIGPVAAWYFWAGHRIAADRPLRARNHRLILALLLPVPVFAVLQALPIAGLLPQAWRALPDGAATLLASPLQTLSLAPGSSLIGAVRAVISGLFFVLMLEVASQPDRIRRISFALFLGVAAHAVLGLVLLNFMGDTSLWGKKLFSPGAATGGFVNRNSFAIFLGFGLCLGTALLMERRGRPRLRHSRRQPLLNAESLESAALWLLVGIILLALVATQSRLGLLASLTGAIFTFGVMQARRTLRRRRLIVQTAVLCGAAAVAAFGLAGTGVLQRMVYLEGASGTRLDIYRQMLGMIATRPLTGFGWDAFAPAFEMFRAPPLVNLSEINLGHNTYLTLWAEMGVLVGSLPLLALLVAGRACLSNFRRRTSLIAQPVAALGVLITAGLHSLGDFSLEISANLFLFLAILALGMARHRGETGAAEDTR
ncbi:O-antigen ligase family protein [Rhodobacter ferrooxidans]|uniref:O-antigen polymerase n=1 Tax=Rhodobacter ferrooxidans TaxID=371731 RepID=C8S388_9RHOB|nr:O-antigen ligase family protein [Rhodobacter sp. SW2]EEW24570.1 O-antigen polymerase [Rhodobacter sp. SW2]